MGAAGRGGSRACAVGQSGGDGRAGGPIPTWAAAEAGRKKYLVDVMNHACCVDSALRVFSKFSFPALTTFLCYIQSFAAFSIHSSLRPLV